MSPRAGRPGLALLTLVAIIAITAAWWALALWPVGASAPEWLARTRSACFGGNIILDGARLTNGHGLKATNRVDWRVEPLNPRTSLQNDGSVALERENPDSMCGGTPCSAKKKLQKKRAG